MEAEIVKNSSASANPWCAQCETTFRFRCWKIAVAGPAFRRNLSHRKDPP
jgi:hypothetical protein